METYLTRTTDYLLTQSWQIAILVVIIAAVNLALRNKSAHVRYLLWLIVLAKCIVPPLLTVPLAILPQEKPAVVFDVVGTTISESISEPLELPSDPVETAPAPIVRERPTKFTIRQWLVAGWMVGITVFLFFNLLKAVRTNYWLWRKRKALPVEPRSYIENLFSAHGIKSFPDVWQVDGISQPFVWGLLRGSIYLPANFLNIKKPEHQKSVLGHELSHVIRFDAAVNFLQVIAQAIFWFHPFVWWANRKIRAEREKCCDEMAVARLNASPKDYSKAILEILAAKHKQTRPVPSLAVAGPVKNIEERIRTMLKPGKKFYKRPSLVTAVVILLIALLTVPTALVLTARAEAKTATESEVKPVKTLHEAAADGDIEQVRLLISKGADVNAIGQAGEMTPLHEVTPLAVAAFEGHAEIVRVLLANGAKVDMGNSYGLTPLCFAVFSDDEETVRALISGGANVNLTPEKEDTPLNYAIWQDHAGIVRALLDAGANAEQKDLSGMSPLQNALSLGNPDIVTLLANTDDKVPDLHRAALKGDLSGLKKLLGQGADINDKDEFNRTSIEYALAAGQSDATKFLLGQGVDINLKKTKTRRRPLLNQASRAGLLEIVQILIARDVPVDTVSSNGATTLHEAVWGGHKEIAELLISKGVPVNSKDRANHTPLHVAAIVGDTNIVELLIAKGAAINASGYQGRTPLHRAAMERETKIIELLIAKGADVNAMDKLGVTALNQAVQRGHVEILELLLSKGANVNAINRRGRTPLELAEQNGRTDIVELLKKHGAKDSSSFLLGAVISGDIEEVKRLIAEGADVNVKDESDNTALHIALDHDSNDIAEFLIDQGADVNATGQNNRTPLFISINHRNKDMVKLLLSKGADVYLTEDVRGLGSSLLTLAIIIQDMDTISLLLDYGAKFDVKNDSGWTDLHYVAEGGQRSSRDIVEFFISKIVDASNLYMAAFTGDLKRVQELIEQGTDVDVKDEAGWTALFWSACAGQTDVAKFLIDNGADINARISISSSGMGYSSDAATATPLHQATKIGELDLVELLVYKGADIDAIAIGLYTPLGFAASGGHLQVVEFLFSKGANVNPTNPTEIAPLRLACQPGSKEVVEFLIDNGADITTEIINIAERRGQTEIVELLREHGAEEGSSSGESDAKPANSPLHEAATAGDIEQVRMLISQGAEVDTKDNRGGTPLHNAGANGRMEVAELLIENGADVNAKDERGWTALHLAAYLKCQKEVAELLLAKGADVNAKDNSGFTPFYFAILQNIDAETVKIFVSKGANVNLTPKVDYPPLHYAVWNAIRNNDADIVRLLVDNGANINAKGLDGWTALRCAAAEGSRDLVEFFVSRGANVPTLHLASFMGDLDHVQSIVEEGTDADTKDELGWTPLVPKQASSLRLPHSGADDFTGT